MTEETTNVAASPEVVTEAPVADVSFLSTLSEDVRGEAGLADFKDANALAKSYISSQKMLGSSVRIPTEDSSIEARQEFMTKLTDIPGVMQAPDWENEESVNKFYSQIGRPEAPSDYKYEVPEGLEISEEGAGQFKDLAHKIGLTNKQVQSLAEFRAQEVMAEQEGYSTSVEDSQAKLKEVWGADYNNRLAGAKAVLDAYAGEYGDAVTSLRNGPEGNNPALLAILAELAPTFQEKGTIGGTSKIQFGVSAQEAQEKIHEIQGNRTHAYYNDQDPGHTAAVQRMRKLYQIANPE